MADQNITSFLSHGFNVGLRFEDKFSSDITSQDDLIIAFFSLLIILLLESILAAFLLRSYRGRISNVGFSIQQFVELARSFRFSNLLRSSKSRSPTEQRETLRIRRHLLIMAMTILILGFAIEGTILVLSSPETVVVDNDISSFSLIPIVRPDWNQIIDSGIADSLSPCNAIALLNANQGNTELSLCVSASDAIIRESDFTAPTLVDVVLQTKVHEFGLEHDITIGDKSIKYSVRGYFTLSDGRNRMLKQRLSRLRQQQRVAIIHRYLLAYLSSAYNQQVGSEQITLEEVKGTQINFTAKTGPPIRIIKVLREDRFREVVPLTHNSTFRARLPGGDEVFRFVHLFLKASSAVEVIGPDKKDLHMGTGDITVLPGGLWEEQRRALNWLSLFIFFIFAALALIFMRCIFDPVGTPEIAGVYANRTTGADSHRPPGQYRSVGKESFRVPA